jgi:HK97 family phage prohead protease
MSKPTKQRQKPALPQHELRIIKNVRGLEVRRTANGARTISGYFATFNTLSDDLGGFVERIKPGAFTQSLRDNPEVLCLYNHNSDLILGRVSSGTLSVSEDSIGLRFNVTLPDTTYANDLVTLMERGDVAACSFAFNVGEDGDTWEIISDKLVRTLVSVRLYEGSIVGSPAYPNTVADLRSCPVALRGKLNVRNLDAEQGSEVDPDDDGDEDDIWNDFDEGDDEDFRCAYRCELCSLAQHSHLSNLTEDDPAARSKKKITRAKSNLSEDDLMQEQQRCAYRCAACRSLLGGHFPAPNAVNEDDADARAHAHLLSLRRR